MGSKGSQTTTSSSTPPKAVMDAYQTALGMASQATSRPYQQYTGQLVAGLSPSQQQGISNINAAQGMALPAIQQGMNLTNQASQGITPGLYNRFYSPYIQDVANNTQANLMESNAQQMSGLKGGAIQQGAFGGDRAGIAQAEMARQQNLAMGQTMGNIYQQGYGQAMGLAGGQVQNLAQTGQQMAGLGAQAQGSVLQGGQADMAAGAQDQATQQAQLQAQYDQYQQYQAYPYQQAQFYGNIAEGIGAGAGGSSSTSTPGPSLASTIFGGLGALGSIYSMSDKRMKENIKPVGKLKDGQTVYSYNFKGHPQTQIGLIAQEVEKTHPEAVKDIGGLKAVDYKAATRSAKAYGGGFSDIPYLSEDALSKLGWFPQHGPQFGRKPNLPPDPQPYQDQPLDADWMKMNGINYNSVQGLKNLGAKLMGTSTPTYSDFSTYDPTGGGAGGFSSGGLARVGYKDGSSVFPVDPDAVNAIRDTSDTSDTSTTGVAPPANPNTTAPSNGYGDPALPTQNASLPAAPKSRNLIETLLQRDMSPEAKAAVLNASFALMSSRSPWFGVALGDAGKVGMQTYYNALGQQADLAEKGVTMKNTASLTGLNQATTAKTGAQTQELNYTNYMRAIAAYNAQFPNGVGPNPPNFTQWVNSNGALPSADQPTGLPSVATPTDKQTPQKSGSQNLPEPPAPGNVLAPESGADPTKPATLPWLKENIAKRTAALPRAVGSPFYDQQKNTLDALVAQRDAIQNSPEYKGQTDFQNTDPLMRQALNTYMKINTSYNGGTLAEAQNDLLGIAQTLGIKNVVVPNDLQDTKAAHDTLLKSVADMIGVLSDKAGTIGAPASTIGLENMRVPGVEADPSARQAVATKLLAVQNYNKDLFNTWDQGSNFAAHQKQFMINHPLTDYMRNAEAQTPAAIGATTVSPATKQRTDSAIKQLAEKFADVPVNTKKWDPVTHQGYVKTKAGWVPQ